MTYHEPTSQIYRASDTKGPLEVEQRSLNPQASLYRPNGQMRSAAEIELENFLLSIEGNRDLMDRFIEVTRARAQKR